MSPSEPNSSAQHVEAPLFRLAETLWERKWIVLGVAMVVFLAAVIWTLQQAKVYEGVCVLEYDPSPPRPLGSEIEEVSNSAINFWQTQEWYETQNRIIESRAVAEKVVKEFGLHHDATFNRVPEGKRKRWRGTSVDRAAELLQDRLKVQQVRDTRLVEVRVKDRNPKRAALLANAIADAYTEKSLEDRLGSTVSALDWLSEQLDAQKKELQAAENSLHEFKRSHDVLSLSLEDRQNIIAQDLERYSKSLTETRTKRIELAARLTQLKAAYNEDPLKVDLAAFTEHPIISELRNTYRKKMGELQALSVKYGQSHPEIRALEEEIQSIRAQMEREIEGLIRSASSELKEVQQTEVGLRNAAQETHEAGLKLNKQEIQYNALKRQEENQSKLYNILLERTTQTDLTRMLHVSNVRVIDRALPPDEPVEPRLLLNILIGLLAGLLLGVGITVLLVQLDRTIRTTEDLEALGLTVLGIVPEILQPSRRLRLIRGTPKLESPDVGHNRDIIVHAHPMSVAAECCRTIRTNLTFTAANKPFRAIAVTSAGPLEGKTTVAINLAITMAQTGKRVLLVDTDLRRPRIHKAFQMSSAVGVTSVLVAERPLQEAVQATEIPNLFVLPSGPIPPNPSELLSSSAFRDFVADTSSAYDRVIFDSPPLGAVTDGAVIAPQIDSTIIVVRANKTTRDAARSAVRRLRDVEAHVVGGVLNAVDLSSKRYGYGGYYYNYEYRASEAINHKTSSAA
ncbi:MAG: polysaccharide biosynthesis tyrosine autokinase [Myxococcales bacterium]|nr:polysaccharide biosynthesis tyrosine autokinase [Myxococcales bacterium]